MITSKSRVPSTLGKREIDYYLETVKLIATSTLVDHYVIGITRRSLCDRLDEYRRKGFHHMVGLEDRLSEALAIDLERSIQVAATSDRSSILYKKYHVDKRDKPYRPNVAGSKADRAKATYSAYMAWWRAE
jgi:hypothetical protein